MKLSILIPAYKAERYIAETLRAVYAQDISWGEGDVEVLVGIDNCPDTLEVVRRSPATYANFRVFMMDSNKGTYVTRNTLITLARGEWVLFFDADDVMKPGMLRCVMDAMPAYDLVRYYCERFKGEAGPSRDIVLQHGSFLAHRRVFERMGGFKAWRCAADTDFHKRIPPDLKQKNILESLFYYRMHEKSLTQDAATGMNSVVRNAYIRQIATQFEYVDPVVNSWKEIELPHTNGKYQHMELDTIISRNEDNFLTNPVGDEIIILNLETGDYLGLNKVGASIWEKIKVKTTVSHVIDSLVNEFEVDRELCQRQTLEYLEKMTGFGLLKMES